VHTGLVTLMSTLVSTLTSTRVSIFGTERRLHSYRTTLGGDGSSKCARHGGGGRGVMVGANWGSSVPHAC
jgi:serine acetyltransferase